MARKYPMTVDEIVTSYRQAKNPQLQIGVLADLNVCTRKEIKDLLAEAGVLKAPPENKGGRPVTFDTELARRLWGEGLTDTEIAAQLGIPVVRFAKWRQRVGLLRPRTAQTRREDTTKKAGTGRQRTGGTEHEEAECRCAAALRGGARRGDGEGPAGTAGCGGGGRVRRCAAGGQGLPVHGDAPAGGNAHRRGGAGDVGGADGHAGGGVKNGKALAPDRGEGCGDKAGFDTAALMGRRPALDARGTHVGTSGRRYEGLKDKPYIYTIRARAYLRGS